MGLWTKTTPINVVWCTRCFKWNAKDSLNNSIVGCRCASTDRYYYRRHASRYIHTHTRDYCDLRKYATLLLPSSWRIRCFRMFPRNRNCLSIINRYKYWKTNNAAYPVSYIFRRFKFLRLPKFRNKFWRLTTLIAYTLGFKI